MGNYCKGMEVELVVEVEVVEFHSKEEKVVEEVVVEVEHIAEVVLELVHKFLVVQVMVLVCT